MIKKTLYESIKHLTGRTPEEILDNLKSLPFYEKYTEALREDLVDLYKMAFEEDPYIIHSHVFDEMMSYYITRTGIYGAHKILRFLLNYSNCPRISHFNKINDAVDYALKYYNQAKDWSLDEIIRYREFFRVLLSDKRITSELDDVRMELCKSVINDKMNESIKHLTGRTPEELAEIRKKLTSEEKLETAIRTDDVDMIKDYIEEIKIKLAYNDFSYDIYFMSTIAQAAIFNAIKVAEYWLQYPFEQKISWKSENPYISALNYTLNYNEKELRQMLLKSQRILDALTPEQIDYYKQKETRMTFNESRKINQDNMKKLNEEDQVFSDAHAKELLNLQVNYNKSLQDLNNKLAKQKSDLAIKYMNIDKQAAAQQATAQKAKVPTQQTQQQPKQTGTTDTTGRPVDAAGNPVKDSYPDILKIKNVLNETESIYDTSGADETELQSLKNYMDAEGIDYKEDESTIEFDDEQLDAEWQDLISQMGLEQTDISADVKDLEDETPEDEETHENDDEDDVVDTLSAEDDDNINIVDVDDEGDENEVFYVKVNDNGEKFVGKVYKLFDGGDWRAKIVQGNSETFEELNYDPDWSEERIISFLEDNYDSVNRLDEDEFDKYIEEPDEEVEESLGGNGNMMIKTEKDKNEDLTKLDMDEEDKYDIKENYHIPTLEEYKVE